MFLQRWEKRTLFPSSLQAENFFGQVIFKPEVCKSFVTLLYHMCTSPILSSVWYLQWRVQLSPSVFYSVLHATSWTFACILCSWSRYCICYIFYLDVAWEPSFQSPWRSGTPKNSICYVIYAPCLQLAQISTFHVSCGCGLRSKYPKSCKEEYSFHISAHMKYSVSSVITMICSFKSLYPACYRNILFDLVVSTSEWPVTKYPESLDVQSNKEFCLCDGHKCQSRNFNDFSRLFKLRSRDGRT